MKTYFFIYEDAEGRELFTNAYKCKDDEEAEELCDELYMNCMSGDCERIYFVQADYIS